MEIVALAYFGKDFFSSLLLFRKLNHAVETGLQNANTPTASRSIAFPKPIGAQQLQYHPSNPIKHEDQNESKHVEGDEAKAKPEEPEWVIPIREKLNHARHADAPRAWAKLCIYRVPHCLREKDDKACIPQTVSLGPYHHGQGRLPNMDLHKWRAVRHILKRTNQQIEDYLDAIKQLEEKARGCYEGPINLSSNEFVEMMVFDSCFVLELFRGADGGFTPLGYSRNDPIFAMRGTMHSIRRDMLMLENQIPFFVLDTLFGIQSRRPNSTGEVEKLAFRFFDPLKPTDESDRNKLELSIGNGNAQFFDPLADEGGLHCLEVFRRGLLSTRAGPKPRPRRWKKMWDPVADKRRQQLIHCVTELKEGGITFKKRKTDRFWDVKFKNGILEIPRLLIHDGTKSLFLNPIAFEQCHLNCTNDITSYVIFMDNLINTPADVSYLHYRGIIKNWLGSDDEVAKLFNGLCQEVAFDIKDGSLSNLAEQVNRYYQRKCNVWRASLTHKYFNNPWSSLSVFAAVVLLALTFAQTFYTVYGYYRPKP